MEKLIRIGIIGTGIAANIHHFPVFEGLKNRMTVTAACNHSRDKLESFAARLDLLYSQRTARYSDYRDLLSRDDIDAVSIILPVELNLEVTRAAVHAGKHVIVEKPLALNNKEARQMAALQKAHPHIVILVAENYRYRPVYREVNRRIAAGEIGRLEFIQWNRFMKIDAASNRYARTRWRIDHRYAGGFLTDGGVHCTAALRDMFGEITPVSASVWSSNRDIGSLDGMTCHFLSAGTADIPPARGILNQNYSADGMADMKLTVMGTEGTMIVDDSTLTLTRHSIPPSGAAMSAPKIVGEYTYGDDGGYAEEYRDFLDAIAGGGQVRSTVYEAAADLELILSMIHMGNAAGDPDMIWT
jgi:predicted dehydrogenase